MSKPREFWVVVDAISGQPKQVYDFKPRGPDPDLWEIVLFREVKTKKLAIQPSHTRGHNLEKS